MIFLSLYKREALRFNQIMMNVGPNNPNIRPSSNRSGYNHKVSYRISSPILLRHTNLSVETISYLSPLISSCAFFFFTCASNRYLGPLSNGLTMKILNSRKKIIWKREKCMDEDPLNSCS